MSGLPDPRIPAGPIADAWQRTKEGLPLISGGFLMISVLLALGGVA